MPGEVPPPPQGWTPPDDITDSEGSFSWWTEWERLAPVSAGASTLYDPATDRLFIEPRTGVFHDEMVESIIEKSPYPKFPDTVSPAAAQFISGVGYRADIPTTAEGARAKVKRLGDKTIQSTPATTPLGWAYKHVAGLYVIDFPPFAQVDFGYQGRGSVGTSETVRLGDLYQELRFENKLPEQRVTFNHSEDAI